MSISSDNPLREGLLSRQEAKPCSLVIFGATGDLTHRKLIPALYNLAADNDLPQGLKVTGLLAGKKTTSLGATNLRNPTEKIPEAVMPQISGRILQPTFPIIEEISTIPALITN